MARTQKGAATHSSLGSFFLLGFVHLYRMVSIAAERAVGARGFKFQVARCIGAALAQWHGVVNVLACAVDAFFVHLVTGTLALHTVRQFASLDLLLVFLLVRAGFVYVGHGLTPVNNVVNFFDCVTVHGEHHQPHVLKKLLQRIRFKVTCKLYTYLVYFVLRIPFLVAIYTH